MTKKRYFLVLAVLILFLSAFSQVVIHDFDSTVGLNNDNTGATFELSGRYVYSGKFSTIVVPSGSSEERS